MEYMAFDLEIAKELPDEGDWKEYAPLGITCAATVSSDGLEIAWHDNYHPKMSPAECGHMLRYLEKQSVPIVTWNGLGFDFNVLAGEVWFEALEKRTKALALDHIDMAFQMLCEKGFMCGLDAAAKGMGLSGKTEGMSGAKAPVLWKEGRKAQEKVLEYVVQDSRVTANLYKTVVEKGILSWVTQRGTISTWVPTFKDGRMLTCRECLELPLPDTSWMDDPWTRDKFAGWALEP